MIETFSLSRRTLLAGAGAIAGLAWAGPLAAQNATPLRIVGPWDFTSLEPTDTGYLLTRLGVAETLVQVEPNGQLVGGVASGWTVGDDKLTWRFPLRAGLTFHDGSPVTAEAVVNSLKRAFSGESLAAVPLDGLSAEGEAVIIRTKTPFSPLPAFLVDYAAILLAPAAYGADGKVQKIIATGPYRLVAIDGKTILDLERFPEARVKARIATVRYTAVANGDTRANIAIAGDADLVYTLAPTALPRITAAGQLRVESLTIPRVRPLAVNCGLPQFSDKNVRRALSLAIDRAGIANAVLRHPGSTATQLLPPILSEWHNPALPALSQNLAEARRLLDSAGWVPGADGIRVKNGVRFAAKLLTLANRPELPPMAAALQAQFKQIGLDISIEVGPSTIIPTAIREDRMEMTMFARTYVNVPEVIATIIPDYTREKSNWGTVNWPERAQMKRLTDAYVASFDATEKARLRAEITALLHDELPVIPVAWFEHTVAVSPRLRDVAIDPYEMRYLAEAMVWG